MSDLILRWCLGIQDTTRLDDFRENKDLLDLIWLCKLSIASFQRWFPDAQFMLFYNGDDLSDFRRVFDKIDVPLQKEIDFVDQISLFRAGTLANPYHFLPQGVWWKWMPFRWNIDCHEISIDTDIICINEPNDWYKWLDSTKHIILAPERFEKILVNTCGDFHNHPILRDKQPLNCGIVGHRKGYDFSQRFFEITHEIDYGYTRDSLFITEQGAINVWSYSLALENIETYILDFEKCAFVRDFIYYLEKGIKVETVHATAWHKEIVRDLRPILERRILGNNSDDQQFLADIIEAAKKMQLYARHIVRRQLGDDRRQVEFHS